MTVEDFSSIGAFSGVHQFCRVGFHSFVGGYSVVTKDVLPYSKTVGNRARIYGVNGVGLQRRGFSPQSVLAIRQVYRLLLRSNLNTTQALERLEERGDVSSEGRRILDFIRSSSRGVILKRHRRVRASDEE